jgi:hypothetical protein
MRVNLPGTTGHASREARFRTAAALALFMLSCPSSTGTVGAAIWHKCDWNISMRLLRPRKWGCARQNSTGRSVVESEIRCSRSGLGCDPPNHGPGDHLYTGHVAGVPKVIGDPLQIVYERERRKSWLRWLLTAIHAPQKWRLLGCNPKPKVSDAVRCEHDTC